MQLDHATIVTPQLRAVRDFSATSSASASAFARLSTRRLLAVPGRAAGDSSDRNPLRSPGQPLTIALDHIAFRIANEDEWQALQSRLDARRTPYHSLPKCRLAASGTCSSCPVPA
jgi:hypothetical protein